ncbi:hypothetical protein N7532_011342 [Penicillium argentinense]|uniref:Autophagy-related protein 1 n=1 Tax=Penicillium argentinense TaxID=1131581 RepID=A0A9W9EIA0_9EURO|nr:uncharacterized protein N7532_011342 [Penicillium argentinense]KAJ5082299.1 hypothetical protein N7532_011342 [Penicillium argentinense]
MSELVKDARLPTKLDPEHTIHTFLESSHVSGRRARRREREEIWQKKRYLGIGVFGTVSLEECVSDSGSRLRAVREVRRITQDATPIDFNRELEAIAKLSQQKYDGCFVKSSGWFESSESLYISMEYIPAGDLQRYIAQPFPEREAQHITLQLLEGLDFMHSNGFHHGDLQPKNIFVLSPGPEWWVKIGDFGIAKRVMKGLTGRQSFNGTPAFSAPELYEHIWAPYESKQLDNTEFCPAVDLWSIGVISYYFFTGQLPFSRQSDLLGYYRGEKELPLTFLVQVHASPEALEFLKAVLARNPSDRLPARDALDHAWLMPLQQDSEAEDQTELSNPVEANHTFQMIPSPLHVQKPEIFQTSQDVLVPGTIDLTASQQQKKPSEDKPPQLPIPLSQCLGFDGDTYKQIVNNHVSGASPSINEHPDLRNEASTTQSHTSESQHSETHRSEYTRQLSSAATTYLPTDTLQGYTRRRSDAAPIPITDLNHRTADSNGHRVAKPESTHSSIKSHDRLSKRIRRASKDIVPKRRRSQDSTSPKETESPMSPKSPNSTTSGSKKTKSHIVEIPGRPQFAEGLPMFPMRSKKA